MTEMPTINNPIPSPSDDFHDHLSEMVENIVLLGDELEVRSMLRNFGYVYHDNHINRLQDILLQRLAELTARQPTVAENHFHFHKDVGQVITRGDGIMNPKK